MRQLSFYATPEQLEFCVNKIQELNPKAAIITTDWAKLSGEQILKVMEGQDNLEMKALAEAHHAKEEAEHEHEHHHHDHDHEDHEHHHDHEDHDHEHDENCTCGCHDHEEHEHHHEHDENCTCGCHDHEHHHHHHADVPGCTLIWFRASMRSVRVSRITPDVSW